jgi:endonuclease/exonuclease/phosphatase family metal-dependent hydrolase
VAEGVEAGALTRQFAKTPYAVAFRSAGTTFILVTLHVVFGKKPADRLGELRAIARWMREWADDTADEYHQNLLVLGDFNIDRQGDPNYEAFVGEGLRPPPELEGLPRTLPARSEGPKFYDQIAWFSDDGEAKLTLVYRGRAGHVEWNKHVLPRMNRGQLSFHVSDHYPLWCEFGLPRR